MPRRSKHKPKIHGTPATKSFRKPKCKYDHDPAKMVSVPEAPGWACMECVDKWYAESIYKGQSLGGIELPTGTVDERARMSRFMPNRAARRRLGGK